MPFTYSGGVISGEWKNEYYNTLIQDLKDVLNDPIASGGTIEATWFDTAGHNSIKFWREGQDLVSRGSNIHRFRKVGGFRTPWNDWTCVHMLPAYREALDINWTQAFQRVMTEVRNNPSPHGAVIYIPPGLYEVDTLSTEPLIRINYGDPYITIVGAGPSTHIRLPDGSTQTTFIEMGQSIDPTDVGGNLRLYNLRFDGNYGGDVHYHGNLNATGIKAHGGFLRCRNVVFEGFHTAIRCEIVDDYVFDLMDIRDCRFSKIRYDCITTKWGSGAQGRCERTRISGNQFDAARDWDDWNYGGVGCYANIYLRNNRLVSATKNIGATCGLDATSRFIQIHQDNDNDEPTPCELSTVRGNLLITGDDLTGDTAMQVSSQGVGGEADTYSIIGANFSANNIDDIISNAFAVRNRAIQDGSPKIHYIVLYGNVAKGSATAWYIGDDPDSLSPGSHHLIVGNSDMYPTHPSGASEHRQSLNILGGATGKEALYIIALGNICGDDRESRDMVTDYGFVLGNQYVENCSLLANIAKDPRGWAVLDSASVNPDVSHNIGKFVRIII